MASDAVTVITNDHRVLESLFEMLKDPKNDRPALVAEVVARLSAHSWAEEEKVYPSLALSEPGEAGEVYHGVEEHHQATELLHKLQTIDPTSREFDTVLEAFIESVEHHVEEEENEILPKLADTVDDAKLVELGEMFEQRRKEILQAHRISDKDVGAGGAAAQLAAGKRAGRADFASMTREELYEKAKDADISGRSQMSKEELVKALQAHR